MLRWWRHAVVTGVLFPLACDATGPDGTRLSGTWSFTILFDQQPAASGSGTLQFKQPDADDPALHITGAFTATTINGAMTEFRDATLSADNVVRFRVEAPYPWQFEGTLSGQTITGRHTLVGGGLSGNWHAQKQITPGPGPISAISR